MAYPGRLKPLFPVERELLWDDLKETTVDRFDSSIREEIWKGFANFRDALDDAGLEADIYVGGSFVTEEPDPKDIDFTVALARPAAAYGVPERQFLRDLSLRQADWKNEHFCDFELFIGHQRDPALQRELDASLNWLCANQMGPPQGTVLVKVGR